MVPGSHLVVTSPSPSASLAPGVVLGGRYRIDHVNPSGAGTAYGGVRLDTGNAIQVLELPALTFTSTRRAWGITHSKLCGLLELFPQPAGHGWAVFEAVFGTNLEHQLSVTRTLPLEVAVEVTLDLAEALGAMHLRGAAHGLLRPAAVYPSTAARSGTVLGYAPPGSPPNPYHCPERGIGGPSPADDVWALAALFHEMVLGYPPPAGGYRSGQEVQAQGIADPALALLLANCLAQRPENRVSMVQPIRDMLTSWNQRRAARAQSSSRPPPPPVQPTPAPRYSEPRITAITQPDATVSVTAADSGTPEARLESAHSVVPKERRSWLVWASCALVALGAGALFTVFASQTYPVLTISGATKAPATSAPSGLATDIRPQSSPSNGITTSAPAAPAIPSSAASGAAIAGDSDVTACVAAQFPPGTFQRPSSVEWLCSVRDPRQGFEKLRKALVIGAGKGNLTPAMSIWGRAQWYGMAAFSVVRASCCPNAEALSIASSVGCPSFDVALAELTQAATGKGDMDAALSHYTKTVRCHSGMGREAYYRVLMPLGGGQETAFRELLKARSHSSTE